MDAKFSKSFCKICEEDPVIEFIQDSSSRKSKTGCLDVCFKIVLLLTLFTNLHFVYRCGELENELTQLKRKCFDQQFNSKSIHEKSVQSDGGMLERTIINKRKEVFSRRDNTIIGYEINNLNSEHVQANYYPLRKIRQAINTCIKGEKGDNGLDGSLSGAGCNCRDPVATVVEIMKGLEAEGLRLSDQRLILLKGNDGLPGPILRGITGIPGRSIKGLTGLRGVKGEQGAVGAPGPQGAVGAIGPQGAVGATGRQGAVGATGSQGKQGLQGAGGLPCAPSPSFSWIPTNSQQSKELEYMAVAAGYEADRTPIYVGRAWHKGGLIPGKVIPRDNAAYISTHGKEIKVNYFEMYCQSGPRVRWIAAVDGHIASGAVEAGKTRYGETLYVGRVLHSGSFVPGKIHPSQKGCYISYKGKEKKESKYEVMTVVDS